VAAVALATAVQAAPAAAPGAAPVRLAAGPSAFPPDVLRAVAAATGCPVQIVPPLAAGALTGRAVDMVELRGEDAGSLIASGGLALIDESAVNGLSDVPGPLRDAERDASGGLRAIPYLWSPQLLLARAKAFGGHPPTSLRAFFSREGAVRAALPDSPLELAVAALYLGIGKPFALARDELGSARQVIAPASGLLHLYSSATELRTLFRRGEIDLALGNPSTLGDQRSGVVASVPSEGTIATERVLGIVAGSPRAGCARRLAAALLAPPAQAQLSIARGLLAVRSATCAMLAEAPCSSLTRALSRALASSSVAVHPVAAEGVTGWPEWVGEWVLLRG
jgi:spermidine/putrescine-binding protein